MNIELFKSARAHIAPYIFQTPTEYSPALSGELHLPIYLKLENWQKTGSFKIRGALNKLLSLSDSKKKHGIITASAGNHGLGVAFGAQKLKIPAIIYVPENASANKVTALQKYDVELVQSGADYDDAEAAAWQQQREQELTFVHPFDDPHIIAGQGTIGLEIAEALSDVCNVIIPIGGGGLISGVAVVLRAILPHVRIIGVQPQASPAMLTALQAGKVLETPIEETIADGLAGRFVSDLTLAIVQQYVDEVVLVPEQAIHRAMKLAMQSEHLMLEGSAAVGLACLLDRQINISGKTVVVLTGRNVDIATVQDILQQRAPV